MGALTGVFSVGPALAQSPRPFRDARTIQRFGIPIEINADNLKVGDVLQVGEKKENGECIFPFTVFIGFGAVRGRIRTIDLRRDELCRLSVHEKKDEPAKSRGNLVKQIDRQPADPSVNRLAPLLATLRLPILRRTELFQTRRSFTGMMPTAVAAQDTWYNGNATNHTWMYGYGGSLDKLTHKDGWMNFVYSLGPQWHEVRLTGIGHSCSGSITGWVNWDCPVDSVEVEGPGPSAYRHGWGEYWWILTSPPSFIHSLFEGADADKYGNINCPFGYAGTIVLGVTRTCASEP